MTPVDETTPADGAGTVPDEPGSRGCLLIAVSYADVAAAVEPVVASVADHILAAPMLGDFVELRFADGGPRPSLHEPDGCPGDDTAATRVAVALTRPAVAADENFFALVVVDQSAATAARFIDECRSNPAIAGLPLECRGFAAMEDRPTPSADDQSAAPDVIVALAGMWTERTLAAGLCHYAEELFRHFATTHQRGITHDELADIRDHAGLGDPIPAMHSPSGEDVALDLQPAAQATDQVPSPGPPEETANSIALRGGVAIPPPSAAPLPPAAAALALPSPDTLSPISSPVDSTSASAPAGPLAPAEPGASTEPVTSRATVPSAAPESADAAAPATRRAWVWRLASRPLRRYGSPGEHADGHAQSTAAGVPVTAITPVFLLLHGVTSPDEQVSWREGRSLSVSLDRKIAVSRPVAFMVRALSGAAGGVKSPLREAGQLSRSDIKRPDPQLEFDLSLNGLRNAVTSDLGSLGRMALPAVRPAVVILAVDIPVADVISAEAYERLAEQASIIWVVPEPSANLISPVFSAGVPVLSFHEGTADEIAGLLQAHACPSRSPDSTQAAPEPVQQA